MRRSFIGLAVMAAILAGASSSPASFSGVFSTLYADLVFRRDTVYSGELDRDQKRDLAAINRVIHAIDTPADDLGGDLRILRKVVRSMAKPSFPPVGVFSVVPLTNLGHEMEEDLAELQAVDGLTTEDKGRLENHAALAYDALGLVFLEFGTVQDRVKLLGEAWKFIQKARRIAERA